jgi:hypothetical protein
MNIQASFQEDEDDLESRLMRTWSTYYRLHASMRTYKVCAYVAWTLGLVGVALIAGYELSSWWSILIAGMVVVYVYALEVGKHYDSECRALEAEIKQLGILLELRDVLR